MLDRYKPQIRTISLSSRDAGRYLRKLEDFLGSQNVKKRIREVEHTIEIETGKIYWRYWLYPQLGWWLVLRDALQIRASGVVVKEKRTRS